MHSDAVDESVGFEAYSAISGVGSGTEHTMFADRQGSVIWVTEPATGQVVAGYEYDGYGQITQTTGTLIQPYGYTGREYDAESGLYHYRARAYDPAAGVFVQVDPIGFESGALNLTGYVEAGPFNGTDPTGLSTADATVNTAIAGGIAGGAAGQVSVGVASTVGQILRGLGNVRQLLRAYDVAAGLGTPTPKGHCDKGPMSDARNKIRKMYKPLESLPRNCDGLDWNVAADVAERHHRAGIGRRLAALRKLELALCNEGGNAAHRDHVETILRTAKACVTK